MTPTETCPVKSLESRRAFVRFLAASPLFAQLALSGCTDDDSDDAIAAIADRMGTYGEPDQDLGELIESAENALDVFDMRVTAQRALPPAHYGYIATGVDGDVTLRANRTAFDHWQIRPHRLVGVDKMNTTTTILGTEMETPIIISPTGSQRAFHPDGEIATARAAKSQKHLMLLSTVATTSVEDVTAAREAPIWYQLYPTSRWDITEKLIARAEGAGCPVVVLTVDLPVSSNRLSMTRFIKRDRRDCTQCHASGAGSYGSNNTSFARKPMFEGTEIVDGEFNTPALTWSFIDRLRASTKMQVVVKGIVTGEDAQRCIDRGAAGIVVSNHGGRAEESGRGTIDSLPDVVRAVRGRVPVILDSGIRRGTDVFKALALGADAVGIGRPYLWGLGAFGQPGVEKVLQILRAELRTTMGLAGTRSLAEIGPTNVVRSTAAQ